MQRYFKRIWAGGIDQEDAIDSATSAIVVGAITLFLIATGYWPFYIIAGILVYLAIDFR